MNYIMKLIKMVSRSYLLTLSFTSLVLPTTGHSVAVTSRTYMATLD